MVILSTLLQVLLLVTNVTKEVAPGPYSIIFGLFTYFFSEIPPSVKGGVLFIPMSDKTFKYLLGLQLMFSDYPSSVWPSLCGLIAGILYRSTVLPFSRLRFPLWFQNWCAEICKCFYTSSRRRRRGGYHQVPEADPNMPQQLFGPPIAQVAPDPARVQTLVTMGFEEGQARTALSRTGNNVEAAVGLLDQGGKGIEPDALVLIHREDGYKSQDALLSLAETG
eukprot:CAMPEP_0184484318 /NCGR_PEP_ID=MMETSP0113_2-20130426/6044_1 /TAXON_ID=91329 /ORGANISM="Norrisiella sphaerica, Strain BC52" /LENGTH=221 /DNA_ID=CAMNT_0026865263 /DNA_START=327 /DNA_END=993 /DNA_ORIENTATION=-